MGNRTLATQLQLVNQLAIFRAVNRTQIIQKPAAATDQLQESLARTVVLAMELEMGGQLINSFGDESDLNRRATGIGGVQFESFYGGFFDFFG